ncbi:arylesterase [Fulvivirgaceae bacterium BMA12]|uniref:Arylesterase n=1 Tax=Agaribacillus aureus TaxID=3051825 RepID=A0ABT8L2Q6_9BACT|nr:arylesterase [Fulvivirgaceae bacterium BMA12]
MKKVVNKAFIFLFVISQIACSGTGGHEEKKEIAKPLENNATQTSSTEKIILFFGNSLTAGYGLEMDKAFPALIQAKVDTLGLNYKVVNAGLSGETTASGNTRIDWVLNQKVDIFILELGGNDGLRGISIEETRKNLQQMIDKIQAKYQDCQIVLAGMQIPPNMGQDYTAAFRAVFPELAEKNEIMLIPFLLANVGGEPELNQPDGIHPNEEGHKIVAENVWKILQEILKPEAS